MKKSLFIFLAALLGLWTNLSAAESNVAETVLWEGELDLGEWSGWQKFEAADLGDVNAGDKIVVTCSEVYGEASQWPQIMLQTGEWTAFDDCPSQITSGPGEYTFEIVESMLESVRSLGVIVKGNLVKISKIVLVSQPTGPKEDIDAPAVQQIWTGPKYISWNDGEQSWQVIGAGAFRDAVAGMKLRFNITDVKGGAQGHITNASWTDMPDATEYLPLSGVYYEFTITAGMLTELQKGGCIVTGVGYTLTSVELINESKLPQVTVKVQTEDVREWLKDEHPAMHVTLTNNEATDQTVEVVTYLLTDKMATVGTYTKEVALKAGETVNVSVDLPVSEPGVYHVNVVANKQLVLDSNIAYHLTGIVSEADAQSDFDQFWATALDQLGGIAPEYTVTELTDKSSSKRKVYFVEMKSVPNGLTGEPETVRGYYVEPVAEGKHPVIITYQGYDSAAYGPNGEPTDPYCPSADSNPEWAEFVLSTRGQSINNRAPYENTYGDWFAYNFGGKDEYYYRGAYMDCVRALDFVSSRDKIDTDNIFAQGASQGGAFTIAAAALGNGRLKAIAPSIPFMGDFPDYFEIAQWPAQVAFANQGTMTDDQMYTFLSYFDTKNLAGKVECPTLMNLSLQDNICPPHTNIAAYNNLATSDKNYKVNDNLKHAVPSEWYNDYMDFFKSKLATTGVADIEDDTDADAISVNGNTVTVSEGMTSVYSLSGVLVCQTAAQSFTINQPGLYIVRSDSGAVRKVVIE